MDVPPTIAIDAMGGDSGPAVTVAAACEVVSAGVCRVLLVGDVARLRPLLRASLAGVELVHAASQVEMSDAPAAVAYDKPDSSLHLMFDLLREQRAAAAVSAGNSGALMVIGKSALGTLPGIDRPAMLATLPSVHGRVRMIDVGASLRARCEHLVQYALMGAAACGAGTGGTRPRVALLNVGSEPTKGTAAIRDAAALLSRIEAIDFQGFVEGDAIFTADIDLIVTDGFAGNVALKVAEGAARMARHLLAPVAGDGRSGRALAALDVRGRNGASLLGLRGCVVKSHGNADCAAFVAAVQHAIGEVAARLPERIADLLARYRPA